MKTSRQMRRLGRLAAVASAAATLAPSVAQAEMSRSVGGPFDVVFSAPPPRAQPTPGSACEIANQYVTMIAADRAPDVPALFAADGQFIGPAERVYRGRAEIATFYNAVHQKGAIPLSFIDRGDECIMELAGARRGRESGGPEQYRLVAIDHFTINKDRQIDKLAIFFRIAPLGLTPPGR